MNPCGRKWTGCCRPNVLVAFSVTVEMGFRVWKNSAKARARREVVSFRFSPSHRSGHHRKRRVLWRRARPVGLNAFFSPAPYAKVAAWKFVEKIKVTEFIPSGAPDALCKYAESGPRSGACGRGLACPGRPQGRPSPPLWILIFPSRSEEAGAGVTPQVCLRGEATAGLFFFRKTDLSKVQLITL